MSRYFLLTIFILSITGCGGKGGDPDADASADSMVDGGDAGSPDPEICDNDIDDDGDGDVDCADIDCAAQPMDAVEGAEVTLEAVPFVERVRFLWEGGACPPLQLDVEAGALRDGDVSVLHGTVLAPSGRGAAGVRVTAVGRPEWGYTETRGDGSYDFAVNAPGPLSLAFASDGFVPAQRTARDLRRGEFAELNELAIVPEGPLTMVDLAAGGVVVGDMSSDASGERAIAIMVPAGISATARMADGSTTPLPTLGIRPREVTVGENGAASMSADLPPVSAYTYAVELGVDGMPADADVEFDRPVPVYLENFLEFPVGTVVPVGSYDRSEGRWVPEQDGVVVAVLSEAGGLAELDTDGDGVAETSGTLAALGVDEEELRNVAATYDVGDTLWRFAPTHFSTWDANWPFTFPDGTSDFFLALLGLDAFFEDACSNGSEIRVERQVLGESVGVVGAGMRLHYTSDRHFGSARDRTIEVRVTEPTVADALERVDVILEIAGSTHRESFPAEPNQVFRHTWDGLDGYGRRYRGPVSYRLRVGHVYAGQYSEPGEGLETARSFAQGGDTVITGSSTRGEVTLWRIIRGSISLDDARLDGLLGLTLTSHHRFIPGTQTLRRGDGGSRSAAAIPLQISRVAGGGSSEEEGTAPADFRLRSTRGVAVGPDGLVYVSRAEQIWRIGADGAMQRFAGTGVDEFSGDGGPALDAGLRGPDMLAFGPDGSLYFNSQQRSLSGTSRRIRRIRPDGVIETVAGNGDEGNALRGEGDGLLATEAPLDNPSQIAVGPDGTVYFIDGLSTLRSVAPDGVLRSLNSRQDSGDDGTPLSRAAFGVIRAIAVGADDTLYVAGRTTSGGGIIWRIGADRRLQRIAGGNGVPSGDDTGDGAIALNAKVGTVSAILATADGTVWVGQGPRLRRILPDGVIVHVAGGTSDWPSGNGGPAASSALVGVGQLALDVDGSLLLTDTGPSNQVRRISQSFGTRSLSEWVVPDQDGTLRFIFNVRGQHLRTETASTGYEILSFTYDTNDDLISVADTEGNNLGIARPDDATVVLTPTEGPVTRLVDENGDGYVDRLAVAGDDAARNTTFTWGGGGLLEGIRDRLGVAHEFGYDSAGRLISDGFAGYPAQRLLRTEASDGTAESVTLTTAAGRLSSFATFAQGAVRRRRYTDGTGVADFMEVDEDGVTLRVFPNGTEVETVFRPDVLLGPGVQVPVSTVFRTPGGRQAQTTVAQEVERDPATGDLISRTEATTYGVGSARETRIVNRVDVDASGEAVATVTSAEGRVGSSTRNAAGQVREVRRAGRHPIIYEYDAWGRPLTVSQAPPGRPDLARVVTVRSPDLPSTAFGDSGVTDGTGRSVSASYDHLGRPVESRDAIAAVEFGYDEATRTVRVTPAGRGAYLEVLDDRGRQERFAPPLGAPTAYEHDDDGRRTAAVAPSGRRVEITYDDANRHTGARVVGQPQSYSYRYGDEDGQLQEITWTQEPSTFISYSPTFDGPLVEAGVFAGELSATLTSVYDTTLAPSGARIAAGGGGAELDWTLDLDGVRTRIDARFGAASHTIATPVEPDTADPTGSASGSVSTVTTVDGFGAIDSDHTTWPGGRLGWDYGFDLAGRIESRTETSAGLGLADQTLDFSYDATGRLETVTVRSSGAERYHYEYDDNDSRVGWSTPGGACASGGDAARCVQVDGLDRLLRYGPLGGADTITYVYGADGDRERRTGPEGTTTYQYDTFGNLLAVDLPDGTEVRYIMDPHGARAVREVDGVRTHSWVHANGVPIAQLDPSGALEVVYIYDQKGWVPDWALHRDGTLFRIVTDQVGSVRAVVDAATGAVVQRYTYSPYGVIESEATSRDIVPLRFAGGFHDELTGLLRFGARDYDPEVGAWTSNDPIGFGGGLTNLYSYVGADPINLIDPSGHIVETLGDAVAVAGCGYSLLRDHVFGDCGDRSDAVLRGNLSRCAWAMVGLLVPFVSAGILIAGSKLLRARRAVRLVDDVPIPSCGVSGCGCFVAGTAVAVALASTSAANARPIESLHVGDRVVTARTLERGGDDPPTAVDETWQVIDLELFADRDGRPTTMAMTVLRPAGWLDAQPRAADGRLMVDLPELEMRGLAHVIHVRGPPTVHKGPGRVVLSTFASWSSDVYELRFEGAHEVIGATGGHLFYSADRQDWTAANELEIGELVEVREGTARLLERRALVGDLQVFNLEVEGHHEYLVGGVGARVHNAYASGGITVTRDPFSIRATVAGDARAFARIEVEGSVARVTDVFRGGLPRGGGSDLVAAALRESGVGSGGQLVFSNITNASTRAAFAAGGNPATSVLGRTGTRALQQLGLQPSSFAFQEVRGKLSLVIGIQ